MRAAVTVREAEAKDLDALVGLLALLFAIETDFAVDAEKQRRGLCLLLAPGPGRLVLAAERDGAVVGMATAQTVISTAEGGPSLLIEDVVVREDCRGLGIGRALTSRIAAWGEGRGATRMQLLADARNAPAFGFYEACGFTPTNLVCLRRRLMPAAGK
jgi:ribosomal protein S18 acetylase RimI-like enzyme